MIRNHNHLFIFWCLFSVNKVIVQGDGVGFQPVCHQLDTEPFAESRFTRRGWTGDKNQFYSLTVFPLWYISSAILEIFFLQGFRHINQIGGITFITGHIEISYSTHT